MDTTQLDATEAAEPLPSSLSDTYQTQSNRNNEEDRNKPIGDTSEKISYNHEELEPANDNDETTCSEIRNEPQISSEVQHHMITRGKGGIFKPKVYSSKFIEYNSEPKNVAEAMMNKYWSKAIMEEYDALMKNRT
ncbi:Retrovirus-related Pol polyprotein from transposon TNT 1-94 [Abeliophyllum distichum]|uniref:Retrovirus-related Pol polyprotein from transposon TNT 1-94 n=1 Tax=Abeliophyllum distichum TaxID=126358 RepID=A0ABD1UKF3_9LAMI